MENKKHFQYLAGICFIAIAIVKIISHYSGRKPYDSVDLLMTMLLLISPFLFIALGLFINQKELTAISAGIAMIITFLQNFYGFYSVLDVLSLALTLIAYILFIITILEKKRTSVYKYSALCIILSTILSTILYMRYDGVLTAGYGLDLINSILFTIGVILVGKSSNNQKQKMIGKNALSPDGSYINQISSLKGLLDKGIITQEEFEEKKKQIIN